MLRAYFARVDVVIAPPLGAASERSAGSNARSGSDPTLPPAQNTIERTSPSARSPALVFFRRAELRCVQAILFQKSITRLRASCGRDGDASHVELLLSITPKDVVAISVELALVLQCVLQTQPGAVDPDLGCRQGTAAYLGRFLGG